MIKFNLGDDKKGNWQSFEHECDHTINGLDLNGSGNFWAIGYGYDEAEAKENLIEALKEIKSDLDLALTTLIEG